MTDQKPKALQLADRLRNEYCDGMAFDAAKELRRLHAENEQLRAQMEAIGAGGVGPIMLAVAPQPPKQKPAIAVPAFNHVAQRKLDGLLADGWAISGYSICKLLPSSEMRHGFVTTGGMVGWWQQPHPIQGERAQQVAAQKDAVFEAFIDFIGTLTGMKPPPIETAPPEIFKPFRDFTEQVCLIFSDARQPQREPLTDEQIVQALRDCDRVPHEEAGWVWRQRIKWARAIEAAHGIGQEGSAA